MSRTAGPPSDGDPGLGGGAGAPAAGAAGAGGRGEGLDVSVAAAGSSLRTPTPPGPVEGMRDSGMFTTNTTRAAAPMSRANRNRRRFGFGTARPYGASTAATPTPPGSPARCPGFSRLGIRRLPPVRSRSGAFRGVFRRHSRSAKLDVTPIWRVREFDSGVAPLRDRPQRCGGQGRGQTPDLPIFRTRVLCSRHTATVPDLCK